MNHIYLDYAATTPIDTEVFEAMKPYFTEYFHNPSGVYSQAVAVQKVLADARSSVANVLSARPQEIVFFDGGTEANNQALLGSIREWKKSNPNKTPHVITTSTEHSSIIELCHHLEKTKECNVDYLDVDRRGTISIKQLKTLINENTVIVSVSYANGEVGTIQDIKEVAKTVRQYKKKEGTLYPYVHTDAAQAAQFCNMNVLQLGIDFMTITGSKIYGPKKIAALYIKNGTGIEPLLFGGDQESSLRPGTENIPYIVGLATALTKVRNVQEQEHARQLELKTFFINEIKKDDSIIINSNAEHSLPHIVNITVPELSSEEIVLRLDARGIACSMKSACTNDKDGDSHVILAMRREDEKNNDHTGSIRFSFGKNTTKKELEIVVGEITNIIIAIRTHKEALAKF